MKHTKNTEYGKFTNSETTKIEVNDMSWGDRHSKIDIREWGNNGKARRGIRIYKEELNTFIDILKNVNPTITNGNIQGSYKPLNANKNTTADTTIVFTVDNFNGKSYVDIRVYVDDETTPTQNGIHFPVDKLADLISILNSI